MTALRAALAAALLALTATAAADGASPDAPVIPPDELVYCTVCHGVQLRGNPVIQAPRLSGMAAWYARRQLLAFKRGWRGTHAADLYGMEMQPMAAALSGDGIAAALRYVGAVSSEPPPATVEGDADAGRALYSSCAACHGADGSGNENLGGPALTVVNDWYLVRQLQNFRTGVRGGHPEDTLGAQMSAAARVLTDDQAVRDVVAYIGSLPNRQGNEP